MVNALPTSLKSGRVASALAAAVLAVASPAAAQHIFAADVLETDAVPVVVTQTAPVTAQRIIPLRADHAQRWPLSSVRELAFAIDNIGAEGLDPGDYRPAALHSLMQAGPSAELNALASEIFAMLVADLRDGRTPISARRAYYMTDPDAELLPTERLMARALANGDVEGVLASLAPSHPDYALLRKELAATPESEGARRATIRANMDRWRWLPRDLGGLHLIVNVPEYRVRMNVNGQTLASHRVIVGAPRTSTPQMFEMVEGVIFNPNWTVPQSIVVGEGLGRRVLNNPNWARSRGYTATRGADGYVSVVQAPGPESTLGQFKLDMPNPHAIFLHDTPNKTLFGRDERALSHGCIRTEHIEQLVLVLNQLAGGVSVEEAQRIGASGEYTNVPLEQPVPVYIAYFTMGRGEDGTLTEFDDIYGRDAPVLASL